MSCDLVKGGCAPAPLVRDWKLLRRIGANDFALGKEVPVHFRDLDAMRGGRHVHVRAIRIISTVTIAAHASPNNTAKTHNFIRSLIHAIRLSDSEGHHYIDGLDGRSLADFAFFDRGMLQTPPHLVLTPGLATTTLDGIGANSNGFATRVTWEIDLAGRVGDQTERLIPLAALQAREAQALRFRVRSELPDGLGSYGAISFAQPTAASATAGVEVWVDLVELDALNVPPRWGVREYERRESSGALDYPEATHLWAVVRPFAEDHETAPLTLDGETLTEDYDQITVAVGGQPVMANAPIAEVVARDAFTLESEPRSFYGEGMPGLMISREATTGGLGFIMLLPPRPRESAPAGRVNYRFGTFAPGKVRFLHSFVLCRDSGRDERILRAAGIAPGSTAAFRVSDGAPETSATLHVAPKA